MKLAISYIIELTRLNFASSVDVVSAEEPQLTDKERTSSWVSVGMMARFRCRQLPKSRCRRGS